MVSGLCHPLLPRSLRSGGGGGEEEGGAGQKRVKAAEKDETKMKQLNEKVRHGVPLTEEEEEATDEADSAQLLFMTSYDSLFPTCSGGPRILILVLVSFTVFLRALGLWQSPVRCLIARGLLENWIFWETTSGLISRAPGIWQSLVPSAVTRSCQSTETVWKNSQSVYVKVDFGS